jgi:hypothetical protein
VIIVLNAGKREHPYGKKQATKRKPHAINVVLQVNI